MSYKSPIKVQRMEIEHELIHRLDEEVIARVTEMLKVEIDKDELLKALAYDRGQYKAGYTDGYINGYRDGAEWMKRVFDEEPAVPWTQSREINEDT